MGKSADPARLIMLVSYASGCWVGKSRGGAGEKFYKKLASELSRKLLGTVEDSDSD